MNVKRAFVLTSFLLWCGGGCSMGRADRSVAELRWEAPAGRRPTLKIVVRVAALESGQGLLGGVANHPSLARSMPNPVVLRGDVVVHDEPWTAHAVTVRFPGYKLQGAAPHDLVALGMISTDTCICLERVPDVAEEGLKAWLDRWSCTD